MGVILSDTAALLVIDVQDALDDPRRPPRNNPDAEANIVRLLAAWRATGRRCVYIRDDSLDPASAFALGQPGNAIKKIVAPLPDEWLIAKHYHSAFIGTDLEARLRGAGITTLIVTGLVANHCVESTVRMAGNLGFDTYLVGDATAAYDSTGPDGTQYAAAAIHAMTLMNLHKEFATITTTDEVLAAVASSSRASAVASVSPS